MLEVVGLAKRFGAQVAVDGVSFRVGDGEAVGLLGPNGAGKTTTVSLISGLLRADAGQVLFDGQPIRRDTDPRKRRLGLVPQELALVEELSGLANLRFFASLQDLGGRARAKTIAWCLDLVGLSARAGDTVRNYSGGMKRRLNLAVALLHNPRLILLDEPTVGVDPQSRNSLFDCLDRLKAEGKSILYTTHYMEEAERLCERIVIIDQGKVVADDGLAGLAGLIDAGCRITLDLADGASGPWLARLRETTGVVAAEVQAGRLIVDLEHLDVAARVLDCLAASGQQLVNMASQRVDLATIFLHLTGRSLRDS